MMGQAVQQSGSHLGIAEDGRTFAEAETVGDDDAGELVELLDMRESSAPPEALDGRSEFIEDFVRPS
jgi:hypothetical protein